MKKIARLVSIAATPWFAYMACRAVYTSATIGSTALKTMVAVIVGLWAFNSFLDDLLDLTKNEHEES